MTKAKRCLSILPIMTLNCPSCGAPTTLKSQLTLVYVCPYCHTLLAQKGEKYESMGETPQLQNIVSPIQVGTRGVWHNWAFEVVGRLQWRWQHGSWNEWNCALGGQGFAWLAEAQGQWMMSREIENPPTDLKEDSLALEKNVTLHADSLWQVEDIKDITCAAAEGELPSLPFLGRQCRIYDLKHPAGGGEEKFASLEFSQDGLSVFVGEYVELDDLKPQNLRVIEGW